MRPPSLFLVAVVLLATAALITPVPVARAATPQLRTQAPGFYRLMVGDYEVTALLDGTHGFPIDDLQVGAKAGQVDALLGKQDLRSPVEGMINAFLINTGDKLILIDTGAGDLYGKDGGLLVSNLKAAGYSPDQVDDIYLTHLHRDHVGGVMLAGKPVFAHAIIHASKREADYWLSNANKAKAPPLLATMFEGAQLVLAPYIAAGRFKTFDSEAALSPGIHPIFSSGHTPGHVYYAVESRRQKLLVWGDTVHVAAVQFPAPNIAIEYDSDPAKAAHAREQILADAAAKGYVVAAAHVSFPGLGHVGVDRKDAFVWIPLNYTLGR